MLITRVKPSILALVFLFFFTASTYPGWMSGDSYTYWVEATGQFLISDWHSPVLSYFWSFLGPWKLGPAIPFLLQLALITFGIFKLVSLLERKSLIAAWLALLLIISSPLLWIAPWIWTDNYIVALILGAMSTFVLSLEREKKRYSRIILLFLSICFLAIAALARPYMFIPLFILTIFFSSYQTKKNAKKIIPLVFIAVFFVSYFSQSLVIEVWKSGSQAQTMLFDLAGIECSTREKFSQTPKVGLVPRELINNPQVNDFCESYDPKRFDTLFWIADKNRSYFRMPASNLEFNQVFTAWSSSIQRFPMEFIKKKSTFAFRLISLSIDDEAFPIQGGSFKAEGLIGLGPDYLDNPYKKMFLSQSNVTAHYLSAPARVVNFLVPQVTSIFFIWISIVVIFIFVSRRFFDLSKKQFLLSQMPGILWFLEMSFVAPALGFRYLFPGIVLNISCLLILIYCAKSLTRKTL